MIYSPVNQSTYFSFQYEPIISPGNKPFVHHIVLYECHPNNKQSSEDYEKWVREKGTQCYTQNMPNDWATCITPIIGWAVGSDGT